MDLAEIGQSAWRHSITLAHVLSPFVQNSGGEIPFDSDAVPPDGTPPAPPLGSASFPNISADPKLGWGSEVEAGALSSPITRVPAALSSVDG